MQNIQNCHDDAMSTFEQERMTCLQNKSIIPNEYLYVGAAHVIHLCFRCPRLRFKKS